MICQVCPQLTVVKVLKSSCSGPFGGLANLFGFRVSRLCRTVAVGITNIITGMETHLTEEVRAAKGLLLLNQQPNEESTNTLDPIN